jgi:hypothetical protein
MEQDSLGKIFRQEQRHINGPEMESVKPPKEEAWRSEQLDRCEQGAGDRSPDNQGPQIQPSMVGGLQAGEV